MSCTSKPKDKLFVSNYVYDTKLKSQNNDKSQAVKRLNLPKHVHDHLMKIEEAELVWSLCMVYVSTYLLLTSIWPVITTSKNS